MSWLAICTSGAEGSAAVFDGDSLFAEQSWSTGRGAPDMLVPTVREMLDGRVPDRIGVDVGPGSFTGVRIGVAAARALGLVWRVPVFGVSSVALAAVAPGVPDDVWIVLPDGRGALWCQRVRSGCPNGALLNRGVDDTRALIGGDACAGPGAVLLGPSPGPLLHARDMARVPAAAQLPPAPLYGRAADALTPAERAAKAAAA